MSDIHLRTVPLDGANDVRLYAAGADAPPGGGTLGLRMLMGMGLTLLLAVLK